MHIYRLTRRKYAYELDGKGAALSFNRWNSKGVAMVYTSSNRALAFAEVAVHLSFHQLPVDYVMIEIEVPDSIKIATLNSDLLELDWYRFPFHPSTQQIGDEFIKANKRTLLKVPSAVVQGEFNYLLNPNHKDFNLISIADVTEFRFDQRLYLRK
jgi:RES domain-containing protein